MIGNRDSSLKIAEKIGAKAVCNNHDADRKAEFLEKEKAKLHFIWIQSEVWQRLIRE